MPLYTLALAFLTLSASHVASSSRILPKALHVPITPGSFNIVDLGISNDTQYNPNIYRDGGGGVTVNGINMIVWSDTLTTQFPENYDGTGAGAMMSFTSNTAGYFGQKTPGDPTNITDFGTPPVPKGPVIPFIASELPQVNATRRSLCWPNSNMMPNGAKTAVGLFPFGVIPTGAEDATLLYNSVVTATLNPTGPTFVRTVQKMFNSSEGLYGSFSICKGIDTYVYLFQANIYGLKVARVKQGSVANRKLYSFWNGKAWTATPPDPLNPAANVFNYTLEFYGRQVGPYFGDVFYDTYHQSYMTVFTDGSTNGQFYVAYPLTGNIVGPWSAATLIYTTPAATKLWNYAGHAYPGWDPSGKTLLLSYTWSKDWTRWALVQWDTPPTSTAITATSTATILSSTTPSLATTAAATTGTSAPAASAMKRYAERFAKRDTMDPGAIPPALYARAYDPGPGDTPYDIRRFLI